MVELLVFSFVERISYLLHKLVVEIEVMKYGKKAPDKLLAIAEDPDTPIKLSADIYKWFAEMFYGAKEAEKEEKAVVVKFEGKLEEWSG